MIERAKHSVFWPGIMSDIEDTRKSCSHCDRNAPSQSMMPPVIPASPEYPFQMIAIDYFDCKGKSWLVIADRFSGWLSLHYYPREATSNDLIQSLKNYFCIFGIAEQISSDDGPQMRSQNFKQFLNSWGVSHRVSSAYFPHSNLRAETAVKSGKRMLLDNTRSDGSPDWDKVMRALMQHRNTPDSEYSLSPAQLVFGRPIRDFLPVKPGQFSPSEVWIDCRESRELALRKRLQRGAEKWSLSTKDLRPLPVGSRVIIQNQHGAGKFAKKWDRTGLVVDDLGYDKYRIKVDGSGRVTDRNRQFLRQFSPVTPSQPGPSPSPNHAEQSEAPPTIVEPAAPDYTDQSTIPPTIVEQEAPQPRSPIVPGSPEAPFPQSPIVPSTPESPSFVTPPSSPMDSEQIPLRRSTRTRLPPKRYSPEEYLLSQVGQKRMIQKR